MPPLFLTAEASGADESDQLLRTHSWRRLGKSARSGGPRELAGEVPLPEESA